MRTILLQAWTLAINTVRDIVRQPLILLLTATCLILTGLLPSAAVFTFGEEVRLVRDGALAFHLVFGLLIAGAAAAATIYTEIKRGTAATVLSKPVGRNLYFLATYAGIVLVLLLFSATALFTSLLSVRMVLPGMQIDGRIGIIFLAALLLAFLYAAFVNFQFRRPFVSQAWLALLPCLAVAFCAAAFLAPYALGDIHSHYHESASGAVTKLIHNGQTVRFGSLIAWQIVPGSVLVSLAIIVLAALSLSFSTRLRPVLSTSACGAFFLLGLIADYLFRSATTTAWWHKSVTTAWLAKLCYQLLPNWQDFWLVDALSAGGTIPWGYVAAAAGYAALYAGAVLAAGLLSFRHVDIQ